MHPKFTLRKVRYALFNVFNSVEPRQLLNVSRGEKRRKLLNYSLITFQFLLLFRPRSTYYVSALYFEVLVYNYSCQNFLTST